MRRFVLCVGVVALWVVLPFDALAQVASGTTQVAIVPSTPPPTLTTATVVTTVLSLVLGIITQMVQTGMFAWKWATPKSWLPTLTIAMTLLGGIVSYLASQSPLVFNAPTIFYAVVAGIVSLMTGSAPGLAVHAHVVVPENVRAIRAKRAAAKAPAVGAAGLVGARGFVRMRLVQGLGIAGIVGLCLVPAVTRETKEQPAMVVEGCAFLNSSGGAQTGQSAAAIGACVILQAMSGVLNVDAIIQACDNVLTSQLVAEIDAILAFYTQAPDAGAVPEAGAIPDAGPPASAAASPMLCGVGKPPVSGAPNCMPQSILATLKSIRTAAAARATDAGPAAAH